MNKLIKKLVTVSMMLIAATGTGSMENKAGIVYGEEADYVFGAGVGPAYIGSDRNYELNGLGFIPTGELILNHEFWVYQSYHIKLTTSIARFSAGDINEMRFAFSNEDQWVTINLGLTIHLGDYQVFNKHCSFSYDTEEVIDFTNISLGIFNQPLIIEIISYHEIPFSLQSIAIYGAAEQLAMATDAKVREFYNGVYSADVSIITSSEVRSLRAIYNTLTLEQQLLMNQAIYLDNFATHKKIMDKFAVMESLFPNYYFVVNEATLIITENYRNYELGDLGFFIADWSPYSIALTTNVARFSVGDIYAVQFFVLFGDMNSSFINVSISLGNYEVGQQTIYYDGFVTVREVFIKLSTVPSNIINQPLSIQIDSMDGWNSKPFGLISIAIYGAANQLAMATDAKVREFYDGVAEVDTCSASAETVRNLRAKYDALTPEQQNLVALATYRFSGQEIRIMDKLIYMESLLGISQNNNDQASKKLSKANNENFLSIIVALAGITLGTLTAYYFIKKREYSDL